MTELLPPDHVFAGLQKNGYRCVLVDPPWTFRTWSEKNQTRAAKNYYDVMTLDDIARMPVADLSADNCALFMWAINPMLPDALQVMKAWGFTYKTVAFTWAKTTKHNKWHIGLGYWTRANTELCLFGTRGKPERIARDVRQLVVAQRREHSRKPEAISASIERLVGGPYVELFARQSRPGWDSWGDEIGMFNPLEIAA